MLKSLHAGCFGLSPAISSQFTVEMCAPARNCKKITKTSLFRFKVLQGHRCRQIKRARHQCLLWYAASLYLSPTIFTL